MFEAIQLEKRTKGIGGAIMSTHLGHDIFGTKCATAAIPITPQRLGDVYRELADAYGWVQVRKPVPGDTYRKMHKPLNEMDGPAFRYLPADITVISPARLYRSTAWKYNGGFHMDAQVYWEFEYEYEFGGVKYRDWMNVNLLTLAYMPSTFEPMNRNVSNQLTLF